MAVAVGQRQRIYTGRYVRVDYQPDRKSIAAYAVGPELREICHDIVVGKALPFALSISPTGRAQRNQRGNDAQPVERYRKSFEVNDTTQMVVGLGIYPLLRVACELANTAPHALIVEKGNKHFDGHHVMDRTLAQLIKFGLSSRSREAGAKVVGRAGRGKRT